MPKSTRNDERNEKMIEHLSVSQSMRQTGIEFGVTRERVRQIALRYGITGKDLIRSKAPVEEYRYDCKRCGKENVRTLSMTKSQKSALPTTCGEACVHLANRPPYCIKCKATEDLVKGGSDKGGRMKRHICRTCCKKRTAKYMKAVKADPVRWEAHRQMQKDYAKNNPEVITRARRRAEAKVDPEVRKERARAYYHKNSAVISEKKKNKYQLDKLLKKERV